jgi:hypothetical protein
VQEALIEAGIPKKAPIWKDLNSSLNQSLYTPSVRDIIQGRLDKLPSRDSDIKTRYTNIIAKIDSPEVVTEVVTEAGAEAGTEAGAEVVLKLLPLKLVLKLVLKLLPLKLK